MTLPTATACTNVTEMNMRPLTDAELELARIDRRFDVAQRNQADREIQRRADQKRIRESKAKIHQNIWGNINGYISGRKVIEFGTDDLEAEAWLATARAGKLDQWSDRRFRDEAWMAAAQARTDAARARQEANSKR